MKKALIFLVAVVAVLGAAGAGAVWYGWTILTTPAIASAPAVDSPEGGVAAESAPAIVVEVPPGTTLRGVTRTLEERGLVRDGRILEVYGRYSGRAGSLQAGRYTVSADMTPIAILEKIISGDAIFDELTITIPEGWSIHDIEERFESAGLFSRERFQEAVVMTESYRDYPFLAPLEDDTILDGYLYPDTYRVFPDSTPESIVRRMLDTFQRRLPSDLLREIEDQGRTLHDVLTLASIVQKESAGADEMPEVAGVFYNRLQIGMRLESDATVNYVLGTSKLQPTFADTEVQHPFNTYENDGLPPGPIGNPGLDAIAAAVHPAEHEYLFFLHKPDREIVLSRTFREHLENKARYLD